MDFGKLKHFLDSLDEFCSIPSCDCSVYFKHKEVFRHRAGYSDLARTKPVSETDLYWIYSCTKVSTCVAGMQMVEQGKMKLSDPISKYLPEYSGIRVRSGDGTVPCEKEPTIEDLFTMSAGFNYNFSCPSIKSLIEEKGKSVTTLEVIRALAQEPLDFQPGSRFQYSMCHDVLAAVVEVVSGVRFSDYVKQRIAKPLGMKELEFHVLPENVDRMSVQYNYDPASRTISNAGSRNLGIMSDNFDSGGGGIVATVSDYVLFADALANGGVGATGEKILTSESIDLMRKNWLDSNRMKEFYKTHKFGYSYGLGVRTLINPSFSLGPVGEFGWDGAAGAYFLVDPDNHVAIFHAQTVLGYHEAYTVVHPKIRDLTYLALRNEL